MIPLHLEMVPSNGEAMTSLNMLEAPRTCLRDHSVNVPCVNTIHDNKSFNFFLETM